MQHQSSFFHVSIENFYTTSDCDGCDKYEVCFFRGIVVYKSQLAFSVILCLPIFAQIKKTSLKFQNSSESTEPIWMDRQMAANIDQRTNDQVEMIWHSGYQLRDNFVNIMLVDINLVDKLVYSEKEYLTFTLSYFLSLTVAVYTGYI